MLIIFFKYELTRKKLQYISSSIIREQTNNKIKKWAKEMNGPDRYGGAWLQCQQ
jgi:hypothetical protein